LLGGPKWDLAVVCGDAIVSGPAPIKVEGCDDGNTFDGDGCSSLCLIEQGYDCETM